MSLSVEILGNNVVEEALTAVSALSNAIDLKIEEYMVTLSKILVNGLFNDENYEDVVISAQVIDDIYSVLGGKDDTLLRLEYDGFAQSPCAREA